MDIYGVNRNIDTDYTVLSVWALCVDFVVSFDKFAGVYLFVAAVRWQTMFLK